MRVQDHAPRLASNPDFQKIGLSVVVFQPKAEATFRICGKGDSSSSTR
jgi:hypothetical protein